MNEWVVKAVILSWEFYCHECWWLEIFDCHARRDLQRPRQLPTAKKNLLQYVGRAAVESPGLKPRVGGGCWGRRRERQDRNPVNGDKLMLCPWGSRMESSTTAFIWSLGEEPLSDLLWVGEDSPSFLATPGRIKGGPFWFQVVSVPSSSFSTGCLSV